MPEIPSLSFQGLSLSAEDLRQLNPKWSDTMINDYLSRTGDLNILSECITTVSSSVDSISADLQAHIINTDNPHEVTAEGVGLGGVGNYAALALDGITSMSGAVVSSVGTFESSVSDGGTAFDFNSIDSFTSGYLFKVRNSGSDKVLFDWEGAITTASGKYNSDVAAGSPAFTLDTSIARAAGSLVDLKDNSSLLASLNVERSVIYTTGAGDKYLTFKSGQTGDGAGLYDGFKFDMGFLGKAIFHETTLLQDMYIEPYGGAVGTGRFNTNALISRLGFAVNGTNVFDVTTTTFSPSSTSISLGAASDATRQWDGVYLNSSATTKVGWGLNGGSAYIESGSTSEMSFFSAMFDAVGNVAFTYDTSLGITSISKGLALWQNNNVDKVLFDWAGGINFQGSFSSPPVTITGTSYTAADEVFILVDDDTAGSVVTIDLPAAASSDGVVYHIKKMGTTANVVVDASGAELIDGAITATLTTQYESIMIACDGTSWSIH